LNKYCVDTNILVYTLHGLKPAVDFMKEIENKEIIYSVIVEAELYSSWKLSDEDKRDLREVLDLGEIIEVNSNLGLKAAELIRLSRINYGRKLKLPDAIIASTAIERSAILVTRNESDFTYLNSYGLAIYNPF